MTQTFFKGIGRALYSFGRDLSLLRLHFIGEKSKYFDVFFFQYAYQANNIQKQWAKGALASMIIQHMYRKYFKMLILQHIVLG